MKNVILGLIGLIIFVLPTPVEAITYFTVSFEVPIAQVHLNETMK